MSPKIINKEEKSLSILKAALGVFSQQGYGKTTIEDIAKAAGIGKGTVYEYFRSKDTLFFALYDHVRSSFHETIYRDAERQKTAIAALETFITATLKAFNEWQEFGFVLLDFWSEYRRSESASLHFREVYALSRKKVASFIQKGIRNGEFRKVDSLIAASAVIAVLDGLLLQRIFDPDTLSRQGSGKQIADIVLGGLRK